MPRNGNGIYSLPAGNPVVTGTTISSSLQNTTMTDVQNALTTSIASDGQTIPTANLPMGGFKLTGLGAGSVPGDTVRYEDLTAAAQTQTFTGFTTAGAAPAFTLTPVPALLAYSAGQRFNVTFTAAGTAGSNTLAVSSLAAKNLKQYDFQGSKTAAYIPANMNTDIIYDGTDFVVLDPVVPPSKRAAPNFVNGGCLVAQRTAAPALSTSRVIGQVDNVGAWASGGAVSGGLVGQDIGGAIATTGYSCRANTVTLTGAGQVSHSIRMEARDAIKYKNKTVSFSVHVAHDVGSTINYKLVAKKPTAADNFAATTVIATSSAISVTSSLDTLLTFNNVAIGDVTNGMELEVQAACGAVTTKNFYATEFYVNIEPVAGTYDAPDCETELARCQRYLVSYAGDSLGIAYTSTLLYSGSIWFGVAMRTTPTLLGGATFAVNAGAAGTPSAQNTTAKSLAFSNSAANWTVGAVVTVTALISAEL